MQVKYDLVLDNSKRADFVKCPRLYYLKNEKNLKPLQGGNALLFGSTIHAMMEGYYSIIMAEGWNSHEKAVENGVSLGKKTWDESQEKQLFIPDYRTLESACDLFFKYLNFHNYDPESLTILGTETIFAIPIELDFYKILFTGKIDLIISQNGDNWIMDHKSTGQSLSFQQTELYRSAQLMGYFYATSQMKEITVSGCQVNYLHLSNRKKKDGSYGTPGIDFLRIPQIYTDRDIETWKESFLSTAVRITHAYEHDFWPCELDSCKTKYGFCDCLPICMQNRPIEDCNLSKFVEIPWDVRGV